MTSYFRKAKSLYSSTTNSFGTGEGETITPSSVSGLPTDTEVVLTFDKDVAGKLERIKGTISGSNFAISSGGRGYDGTTEQSHTSPTVEYIPNGADINDHVDGILIGHTQAGLHKSALPLTSPRITTSIDDSSGNELFKVTATGSAVNEFTVANAAAGNSPTISATGSDTDIDINLAPKGAGDVNLSGAANNIQVAGSDPKRGIYVPASAMFPATTSGCATLAQAESSTNKINYKVLDFDQSSEEYAWFVLPAPSYWDLGTITAEFHWTAASGTGDVIWGIAGLARSNDDAIDTALGTAVTVTDTLIATGDHHLTADTSAITIGGTPAKDDFLYVRVYRDADAGGDTLNADARLIGVTLRFTRSQYDDQ